MKINNDKSLILEICCPTTQYYIIISIYIQITKLRCRCIYKSEIIFIKILINIIKKKRISTKHVR